MRTNHAASKVFGYQRHESLRKPIYRRELLRISSVFPGARWPGATCWGAALLLMLSFLVGWRQSEAASAQYVYDAAGRLVQVIGASGSSTQYVYDLAGNLLTVTPLTSSTAAVTGFSAASASIGPMRLEASPLRVAPAKP